MRAIGDSAKGGEMKRKGRIVSMVKTMLRSIQCLPVAGDKMSDPLAYVRFRAVVLQ
jgi:hypothetical protein